MERSPNRLSWISIYRNFTWIHSISNARLCLTTNKRVALSDKTLRRWLIFTPPSVITDRTRERRCASNAQAYKIAASLCNQSGAPTTPERTSIWRCSKNNIKHTRVTTTTTDSHHSTGKIVHQQWSNRSQEVTPSKPKARSQLDPSIYRSDSWLFNIGKNNCHYVKKDNKYWFWLLSV